MSLKNLFYVFSIGLLSVSLGLQAAETVNAPKESGIPADLKADVERTRGLPVCFYVKPDLYPVEPITPQTRYATSSLTNYLLQQGFEIEGAYTGTLLKGPEAQYPMNFVIFCKKGT